MGVVCSIYSRVGEISGFLRVLINKINLRDRMLGLFLVGREGFGGGLFSLGCFR